MLLDHFPFTWHVKLRYTLYDILLKKKREIIRTLKL